MTKLEILKTALASREDEILGYQVNIDNYTLAIDKINNDYASNSAMLAFRDHLTELLEAHITEQLKAIIIRDVIADQLTTLEAL